MNSLFKNILILIQIICFPVLLLAQTTGPKISISVEQNLSEMLRFKTYTKHTEYFDFIGQDDDGFLIMKNIAGIGKEFNFLYRYDLKNFDVLMKAELDFPKLLGKKPDHRKSFILNGKLCVFVSVKDSKTDKDVWFVQRVDGPNYTLTSEFTKLWESPHYEDKKPDDSKKIYDISFLPQYKDLDWTMYLSDMLKVHGDVKFYFSPDSSKILIDAYYPFSKDQKEKHSYLVFDSEMNVLVNVEKEFDYEEEQMQVMDVTIDNEGNFYSLITMWKGETASNFITKQEMLIYSLANKSFKHSELVVDEGIEIEDMGLAIGNNSQLFIQGIYRQNKIPSGWFSCRFENDNFTKVIYNKFSETHQTDLKKLSAIEQSDTKGRFYLRESGVNPVNGNMYSVFEYEFAHHWTTGAGSSSSTSAEIISGNIIYIEVLPEDGSSKLSRFSKLIQTRTFLYPSFALIQNEDNNYLFYNDQEVSGMRYNKIPTLVNLSETGNGKKQVIFEPKSTKMGFDPANYLKLKNGNEIIFIGKITSTKHQFVKFSF